ncbi:MAG: phospho-N-acetylmuramoyl-pentapeptide-transferase [Caldisericia bacterium]|nr:phospho-N-acetylmuramoyl-pentapeptide-transferase [Caldisericia bacterium]
MTLLKYGISFIVCFFLTTGLMPIVVSMLKKFQIGQFVREEGPQAHLKKQGTPTMGGLVFIFVVSCFFTVFLIYSQANIEYWLPLYAFIAYGLIGYLDDYKKTILKSPYGLKAREDISLQLVFSVPIIIYSLNNNFAGYNILFIIVLELLIILSVVNSVNLTDGVDGLLSSVSIPIFVFYSVVLFSQGKIYPAIFAVFMIAGLLGFILYNAHPAKVFMGNVGSFAIGGAIVSLAVISKTELLLLILCFIFVTEAMSVIIQVAWFKYTKRKYGKGKRVFKMSPLHHHFELSGHSETQIMVSFTVIQIVCCVLASIIYFL